MVQNGNGLDCLRNFLWDFWIYVPSSSQNIQATEFDFFQYHAGTDSSGNPRRRGKYGAIGGTSDTLIRLAGAVNRS